VRAFAALRPISDRHLPAYTVGAATARAAREAGFVHVVSAEGDAAALARLITAAHDRPSGVVPHPCALEPAGDLIGDLEGQGVSGRAVAVYETAPQAPSADLLAALDADPPGVEAVLIHSPRAGAQLARLLDARPAVAPALAVICISRAAAEPLKPFKFARRAIADAPNEPAMFARLNP
jgi:uroporphyrinogen-III synthase